MVNFIVFSVSDESELPDVCPDVVFQYLCQ